MGRRPIFCLRAMYRQNQALVKLLDPAVSAMGYELWGLEHLARGRRSLLRVYIDRDAGVSIADCERVSKQLTGILDVEDPIRGSYDLEVSSPGLDRPLFTLGQFNRFIGHEVRLRLKAKVAGRRQIFGRIDKVEEGAISIQAGAQQFSVPPDLIEKARLVPQI